MVGQINTAWFVAILVALFVAFNFVPAIAIWAATHEDQKDILRHGISGRGVVASITCGPLPRGAGRLWTITVRFEPPGHDGAVTFDTQAAAAFWFTPRLVRGLAEGQPVAIHYREKWPSLAVIDAAVSS
jgi:hypothetical protein